MNYWEMLAEHLKLNPDLLDRGGINHVSIQHNDGCPIFKGSQCNCSPSIASGPAINAKYSK
jgi:hypothetical protein